MGGLPQFTIGIDDVYPGVEGARYYSEVSACPCLLESEHFPTFVLLVGQICSPLAGATSRV